MRLEQAIATAIDMEGRIRDLYAQALEQCDDPAGKRVFDTLRKDEQYHQDYLKRQLKALGEHDRLDGEPLTSRLPGPERIRAHMDSLAKVMATDDRGLIQQLLTRALKLEIQTSRFYEEMLAQFTDQAREMFARFVEIENAHIQAVQYELDYVLKTGYWFDFKEFDME